MSMATRATGLVIAESFVEHLTGDGHPEQPARVTAIVERLVAEGLLERARRIEPVPAADESILRCHTADARARTLSSGLNASSVGVLVAAVDEGGGSRTQYANEAYLTLMGCAREDLIGRAPDFGQGRADDDGLRVVQEAYARRAQCDRVVCFERPDGSAA